MMIRFLFFTVFSFLAFVAYPQGVLAQLTPSSDNPVAIEADNAIEWLRDKSQYIARGNAVASQGSYSVKADALIADYNETAAGKTEVWRFTADKNVVIKTGEYTAYGDQVVHDVKNEKTVMTGRNMKIESGDDYLTANDKLIFWGKQNKAKALGRPKARQANQIVEANEMTAYFKKDKRGKLELREVQAVGDVIIVTPLEVLRGERAVYTLETGKAKLTGNVRITRGSNQLNGEEVILDTVAGTSTITTGIDKDTGKVKRVRGLFSLQSD